MLVRTALMDPALKDLEEKEPLLAAFHESCALLGDCYSRFEYFVQEKSLFRSYQGGNYTGNFIGELSS